MTDQLDVGMTEGSLALPISLAVIGGLAGLFFVRYFVFNDFEELAWILFWESLKDSGGGGFTLKEVLTSNTFYKSTGGFVVGAVLGAVTGRYWIKR